MLLIETSPSISKLVEALCLAQREFGKVVKDKEAKVQSEKGSGYQYKYADLASMMEATASITTNGLSVIQFPCTTGDGKMALQTVLAHSSGEWMTAVMLLPSMSDRATPQQLGSLITYCKKYAYGSILGIASEDDDDDGAEAEKAAKKEAAKAERRAVRTISEDQRKELFQAVKESGMPKEEVQQLLQNVAGVTASRDLPEKHFQAVMTAVKEGIRAE
jgi:hypothetical protein